MERFENGGGSGIASAEFAGEIEGVGNSAAGEVKREGKELEDVRFAGYGRLGGVSVEILLASWSDAIPSFVRAGRMTMVFFPRRCITIRSCLRGHGMPCPYG